MLDNTYEIVGESKITYINEVWCLKWAWKLLDKVHGKFFNKLL